MGQVDQENLRSHSIASKNPSSCPEYVRKISIFENSVGAQGRRAGRTKKSIYAPNSVPIANLVACD
jgi:hypothetical protein